MKEMKDYSDSEERRLEGGCLARQYFVRKQTKTYGKREWMEAVHMTSLLLTTGRDLLWSSASAAGDRWEEGGSWTVAAGIQHVQHVWECQVYQVV